MLTYNNWSVIHVIKYFNCKLSQRSFQLRLPLQLTKYNFLLKININVSNIIIFVFQNRLTFLSESNILKDTLYAK